MIQYSIFLLSPPPTACPFVIREREKLPPESLLYVFTYSIAYSRSKEKKGNLCMRMDSGYVSFSNDILFPLLYNTGSL